MNKDKIKKLEDNESSDISGGGEHFTIYKVSDKDLKEMGANLGQYLVVTKDRNEVVSSYSTAEEAIRECNRLEIEKNMIEIEDESTVLGKDELGKRLLKSKNGNYYILRG